VFSIGVTNFQLLSAEIVDFRNKNIDLPIII
jgi:hypothetical protein